LPNAVALIAPRVLLLHNTGDNFDTSMAKSAYALKHAEVTIESTSCGNTRLLSFVVR
jgi:hypothetical protein